MERPATSPSTVRRPRLLGIIAAAVAAQLALGDTAALAGQEEIRWRGPLRIRSQFPLDLATLDLTPEDAGMLGWGHHSLELTLVHSNTFELTKGYDMRAANFGLGVFASGWDFNVDSETTRVSLRYDLGLGEHFQLGIEVPALSHSGGFMDSAIDEVHRSLGLPDNDRDKRPEDELNIDLIAGSGRIRLTEDEMALGDVVLRGKFGLYHGFNTDLAAVVEAKAPTGDEESFAGTGEWDYGLTLLLSGGGVRHFFHGGVGYQSLGQPELWPIELEDRTSAFAGYEFRASQAWSIAVQALAATSMLPEQDDRISDGERVELGVGAHYGHNQWQISFGFVENLTTNDNTADVGIFFASRWWL